MRGGGVVWAAAKRARGAVVRRTGIERITAVTFGETGGPMLGGPGHAPASVLRAFELRRIEGVALDPPGRE